MSDSLWPHGLYSPWISPGQNTRMGSHSLLQGIFPTQGWNLDLPHCWWILYQLSYQGSLMLPLKWRVQDKASFLPESQILCVWWSRSNLKVHISDVFPILCVIHLPRKEAGLRILSLEGQVCTWAELIWTHSTSKKRMDFWHFPHVDVQRKATGIILPSLTLSP